MKFIKIISNLKLYFSQILKLNRKNLVNLYVKIACIFTLVIFLIFFRHNVGVFVPPFYSFIIKSFLEIFIILSEVMLCLTIAQYVFNSYKVNLKRDIICATFFSLSINCLIMFNDILKLFDIKIALASTQFDFNTLHTINLYILTTSLLFLIFFSGFIVTSFLLLKKKF